MPRPIRKTFGYCRCPWEKCKEPAHVKRFKDHPNGKLYLWCPKHGRMTEDSAREHLAEQQAAGRVHWLEEPPEPPPVQDPVDAKTENDKPPPAPPLGQKPRRWFDPVID